MIFVWFSWLFWHFFVSFQAWVYFQAWVFLLYFQMYYQKRKKSTLLLLMTTITDLWERWVWEQIMQKLPILEMWSFTINNKKPNKKEPCTQILRAFSPRILVMHPFADWYHIQSCLYNGSGWGHPLLIEPNFIKIKSLFKLWTPSAIFSWYERDASVVSSFIFLSIPFTLN